MLQQTMVVNIQAAAKRYRVHPTLLLVSIDALTHNEHVTEKEVIGPFFRALSDEFKRMAEADILSRGKKRKGWGQLELSPITKLPEMAKYIQEEHTEKIKTLLPGSEEVRFLHHRAYNHVMANFLRMRMKWEQAIFTGDAPDAVQIIKLLFQDLLQEYQAMIEMFKGFDITKN